MRNIVFISRNFYNDFLYKLSLLQNCHITSFPSQLVDILCDEFSCIKREKGKRVGDGGKSKESERRRKRKRRCGRRRRWGEGEEGAKERAPTNRERGARRRSRIQLRTARRGVRMRLRASFRKASQRDASRRSRDILLRSESDLIANWTIERLNKVLLVSSSPTLSLRFRHSKEDCENEESWCLNVNRISSTLILEQGCE